MDHRVMAGVAISALCGVIAHAHGSVVIDRVHRGVYGSFILGMPGPPGDADSASFANTDPGGFVQEMSLSGEFGNSSVHMYASQSSYISGSRIQASLYGEGSADLDTDQRAFAMVIYTSGLSLDFTIIEPTPVVLNYAYERDPLAAFFPAVRLTSGSPSQDLLEGLPTGGFSGVVENHTLVLEPGSYSLLLQSRYFTPDRTGYAYSSFESWADLHFDMVFIPSPGSFAPLALAGLAAIRRRR